MKRQIDTLISSNLDYINNSTSIQAECGVSIQSLGSGYFLGKLKIPYTLTQDEIKLCSDFQSFQLKMAQKVYPVRLIEVIYNNGDDKVLYIKGIQGGVEYRCNVRTSKLTVQQQAIIQAFHDFIENNIKQGFDILQWYPPTLLKVDELTVNTDELGQSGNDTVFYIGECLKEVLIDNYVNL